MCESELVEIDQEPQSARRMIEDVIAAITYKPGYSFSWKECEDGRFQLTLSTTLLLSAKEQKCIRLDRFEYFLIEECQTHAQVRECFIRLILGWERHEMYEWLKFGGVQFKDPHTEEL